jgi:hypothetical protein
MVLNLYSKNLNNSAIPEDTHLSRPTCYKCGEVGHGVESHEITDEKKNVSGSFGNYSNGNKLPIEK